MLILIGGGKAAVRDGLQQLLQKAVLQTHWNNGNIYLIILYLSYSRKYLVLTFAVVNHLKQDKQFGNLVSKMECDLQSNQEFFIFHLVTFFFYSNTERWCLEPALPTSNKPSECSLKMKLQNHTHHENTLCSANRASFCSGSTCTLHTTQTSPIPALLPPSWPQ